VLLHTKAYCLLILFKRTTQETNRLGYVMHCILSKVYHEEQRLCVSLLAGLKNLVFATIFNSESLQIKLQITSRLQCF